MTKKWISLIAMLLVICMAFAACGGKGEDTKEGDDQ